MALHRQSPRCDQQVAADFAPGAFPWYKSLHRDAGCLSKIRGRDYAIAQRTTEGAALRLGITTRDVAELSQRIASAEHNPEYQISTLAHANREFGLRPEHLQALQPERHLSDEVHDLLLLYGLDLQRLAFISSRPSPIHPFG